MTAGGALLTTAEGFGVKTRVAAAIAAAAAARTDLIEWARPSEEGLVGSVSACGAE